MEEDKNTTERYELLLEENHQLNIKNEELEAKVKELNEKVKELSEKLKGYEEDSDLQKIDIKNIHGVLKEWVPKQTKKINYSLEYLSLMSKRIDIEGIDSVGSRRKNKLNKIDYRLKLIRFYEEGVYQSENFMVYHAQLLGGGYDLEQLKVFISKINRIKSKAATIGAYELEEQAKAIRVKGESGDITDMCNLLGGFIREYKKILKNISEALELDEPEDLMRDDHVQVGSLEAVFDQYYELPRYIPLSEEVVGHSFEEVVEDEENSQEEEQRQEEAKETDTIGITLEELDEIESEENINQILEKLEEVKTALEELRIAP